MFIRAKKIKKHYYAYAVKNKWTKKGSRQKIVGYLGRVYPLEITQQISFSGYLKDDLYTFLEQTSAKNIIKTYIAFELYRHGFSQQEKNIWKKDDLVVNSTKFTVKKGKSEIVLQLNNDYFCTLTLKKLLKFRSNSDEEECGKELAQAFVGAGIAVEPEVFIEVFRKIFKEGDVSYVK